MIKKISNKKLIYRQISNNPKFRGGKGNCHSWSDTIMKSKTHIPWTYWRQVMSERLADNLTTSKSTDSAAAPAADAVFSTQTPVQRPGLKHLDRYPKSPPIFFGGREGKPTLKTKNPPKNSPETWSNFSSSAYLINNNDSLRIYGKALPFLKLKSSRQPTMKIWWS